MAIDTSIYGQIRQPEIESPVNALARVTQLKNAQNQNRLFDMKVAESERAETARNALSDAWKRAYQPDGTLDEKGLVTGLAQGGFGSEIPGIQKGLADSKKAAADAMKSQLDAAGRNAEIVGQYMTAAKQNPALYPQILTQLREMIPGGGKDLPDQFDPAIVDATITRAMSVKDQVTAKQKEIDQGLAREKFVYDQKNDAANRGVTIRGQNMVDDRARDNANQGKIPPGYRQRPDGNLEAIPGGPADSKGGGKPLTEGQAKAGLFGTRMQEADKIINGLSAEGINNSVPGSRAPVIGGIVTAFSPAKRQQLDQAKRDFINATLRRESGAVISPEEFDNGDKQYFPQPGDSKQVIAQKARNRQIATRGVLAEVPESRRNEMVSEIVGQPPAGSSNIDSLLDKYK